MEDFKSKVIEVKSAYDLAEYIENSGVSLKPNGAGRYKGLCPFHMEKTPSFIVNEAFQSYRCFGCGAHGDLLSFVQEYETLSFIEALSKLAEARGITIERSDGGNSIDYRELKRIVKHTARFFRAHFKQLPESHPAKKEIIDRGLSLNKMAYGYAPEGRTALYDYLSKRGFKDDDILLTGVCKLYEGRKKPVDFWNGRLMFFIQDITGGFIGFSSRKINENDKGGKYINSPDSPIFNKSKALYNISHARTTAAKEEKIYVTEGQFDVAALVEAGLSNVVASSGTAFTEEHAMMCRRLVRDTGEIIFCFDGDSAGRGASRKVFEHTPLIHSQAWAVPMPAGKDPCDLREDLGNENFVKFLEKKKVPLISYILDGILESHDTSTELGREAYLEEAMGVLRSVTSVTLRDSFLRKVAINSFTPIDLLRESIGTFTESKKEVYEKPTEELLSDNEVEQKLLDTFDEERFSLAYRIMSLLVEEPELKKLYEKEELEKIFPKVLRETLEVLLSRDDFIIEAFPYPLLMEKVVERNFFPLIHVMDSEDRKKQFVFIVEELREHLRTTYADKLHRQISASIDSSDITVFEEALKVEAKRLNDFEGKI